MGMVMSTLKNKKDEGDREGREKMRIGNLS